MFHVKLDDGACASEPPAAMRIFGDRLDMARRYHQTLATAGVERGLIGPREVPRLWERHILNCAVVADLIPPDAQVVDVGSGAGLPGIPLALARPDLRVTLVEPLLRRTRFLEEFLEDAGLAVSVLRGRAEEPEVLQQAGGADIVTSRAVAPLGKLAGWSLPLLCKNGVMLALKGASAAAEVARDRAALLTAGVSDIEIVECGRTVLAIPTTVIRVRQNAAGRSPGKKAGRR